MPIRDSESESWWQSRLRENQCWRLVISASPREETKYAFKLLLVWRQCVAYYKKGLSKPHIHFLPLSWQHPSTHVRAGFCVLFPGYKVKKMRDLRSSQRIKEKPATGYYSWCFFLHSNNFPVSDASGANAFYPWNSRFFQISYVKIYNSLDALFCVTSLLLSSYIIYQHMYSSAGSYSQVC